MSCGRMYFGARGRTPKYGMSVADIRASCKAQGLVYDNAGGCRGRKTGGRAKKNYPLVLRDPLMPMYAPKPKGREPKYGVPVAKIRETCKAQGLVYDGAGGCRPAKERKAPPKRAPKYGVPMKVLAAQCRAQGLVLDSSTGLCRPAMSKGRAKKNYPLVLRDPLMPLYVPKPKGRSTKYGSMTAVEWRKHCSNMGLVYNGKGECRERKSRGKKAGFGLMKSTPSEWRPGAVYYNASKFNKPNLLLGESFKAVANRAAKQAATTAATKAATKVAVKAADKAAMKAADKAVAAAFGRRM